MGLRKATETKEGKPLWLAPLIDPDAAGVQKADFARLSKHIQEIQREITQKAFNVAERELKKRDKPLWKNQLEEETKATRAEMEKQPDFKAWESLVTRSKDDPFSTKLDRNEVDALYNRESPADYAAFQKDSTRASESLPKGMFDAKNGEHPDAVAERFGYNSGKDMLDAIRRHETNIRASEGGPKAYFDGLIKAEAERRMEAKHGNLQDTIMREALEMALDVKQIDVLSREIELLGGEKITKQKMLDKAKDVVAGYKASALKSASFIRKAGMYGEAAFRAANKEKWVEALEAKQHQRASFIMAREAKAFEAEKAKLDTLMDRYRKSPNVTGVDQGFTDQIHDLMARVGEKVPRTAEGLEQSLLDKDGRPVTLRRFAEGWKSRYDLDIPIGDSLDRPRLYKEMSVEQIRELKDAITSLDFHGKGVNTVMVKGKAEALENLKGDVLLPHLDVQARNINTDTRTAIGQLKTAGRWIDSSLLKMAQLFQWLDKHDSLGPFTTLVYRRLKDAEFNFLDHYKALADDWNKNVPIDKAWKKSLNRKTQNTVLADEDGKMMTLYRDQMIAMAANIGNDWNLRVLTQGRHWHQDDVMQYLHQNMTKKDWDVVQSIWDRFEKLWPDVRDASERRSGVAVERIPARTVTTPFGDYKGGYYPLMESPGSKTLRQKAFGMDPNSPFMTLKSVSNATNSRTGAVYPIDLSMDRLPYVIRQTLHEIHFGDALTDTAKIMTDPLILRGIEKAFGPEYANSVKPWLSYIATDGGTADPSAVGWLSQGSRFLRQNMVTELVGFRPSTAAIHGGSALANSWAEVVKNGITDHKYLGEALSLLSRDPATGERYSKKFADESGELRNRFHNWDRDMAGVLMRDLRAPSGIARIGGDQYDRLAYQTLATKHIAYLDYASALVVYAAKRAESLAKGMPLEDAIFTAEQTLRNAHGSAGLLDVPAIARGSEGWKWFTTFYSYFNHNYNRLRDSGRFARDASWTSPAAYWQAVSRTMGYLIAPAIIHEYFRAPPKDDDESWAWWMTKGIGTQVAGVSRLYVMPPMGWYRGSCRIRRHRPRRC
jgi:hypothetical protein